MRNKRIISSGIILCLFMLFLLTGCTCKHEWVEATCDEPKTCKKCKETEGKALEHKWTEANCINPKTCESCGKTEGEAYGHKWQSATCTEPKICSVCKKNEGSSLGHSWQAATYSQPKMCKRCKITEGKPLSRPSQNHNNSNNNSNANEDEVIEEIPSSPRKCRVCDNYVYKANGTTYYYCYGHICHAPNCGAQAQGDLGYCPGHIPEYLPNY